MNKETKWIWLSRDSGTDTYADFLLPMHKGVSGEVRILISTDSDYVLKRNGECIASGQYGDFPHYKIYDEIFTEASCTDLFILTVHYIGHPTSRYYPAQAGAWVEIYKGEEKILQTSELTLSRQTPGYAQGLCTKVTSQLGFSFSYDLAKEDREGGWSLSKCVDKECTLYPRPIAKHRLLDPVTPKSVKRIKNNTYLVDLGEMTVGLCTLSFSAKGGQHLVVSWGEHIKDGTVRRAVGGRRFSFDLYAKEGENNFTEYMLRLGARYLEITSDDNFDLHYLSLIPQVYEARPRECSFSDSDFKDIYEMCVRTLRLCMMEHYVDCPWREQALYAFDSRNQMLAGYYAFEGKNSAYARASLKLLSEDRDKGALLSICSPCAIDLLIPSFSLHYVVAMEEYERYTADKSLAVEYMDRMCAIADWFLSQRRDGVVCPRSTKTHWNFYDWSEYAEGRLFEEDSGEADLFINSLTLIALTRLDALRVRLGMPPLYCEVAEELRCAARRYFCHKERAFTARRGTEQFTELGAALSILSGIAEGYEEQLCRDILSHSLIPCSLSCRGFVYDALIMCDGEKYAPFILSSIKESYLKMRECGNGTVWETELGEQDFDNAGSLCHGWSAIAIYYMHLLGAARYLDT